MELSFLKLLNTSISASWLILAVVGLRFVLKKAPKSIHCLLWALVAVRLLMPFSIESSFSLVPSAQTVPEIYLTLEGESLNYGAVLEVVGNSIYPQSAAPQPIGSSIDRVQIQDLFWTVNWMVGAGVLTLYALVSYLRLRHKVAPAVKLRENIWVCDYIDTPFILGLIRPRIYLPSTLTGRELVHVLNHERAHLKRKDHWWKPLGFVLLTVYWFNPAIWLAYILLCRDIEMACDEKVIRDLEIEEKKAYSTALLNCSVKRHMIAACPLAFGEVGVKARVKSVLNYKKPTFWVVVIAVILCIAVAVCFLTDPVPKPTPSDILTEVTIEDVEWAQVTFWEKYGGEHLMLTSEQTEELLGLLKRIDRGAYVEKDIDRDLSLMINCGEKEILLQWDGSFVTFSWDSDTSELVDNIVWGVQNSDLNGFLQSLADTHNRKMTLEDVIALSQRGENLSWADLEPFYGIDIGSGLFIMKYPISEDFALVATSGSLEGNPMRVVLVAGEEEIDIRTEDVAAFVERNRTDRVFVDQDTIRAIAKEALRDVEQTVVASLDPKLAAISTVPSYMVTFDSTSQLWRVGMYMVWDSSPRAEVYLDVYGNLVDWQDWGIMLLAEDVTASGLTLVCQQYGSVPGDKMTSTGGYQAQLMTGQPYWLEKLEGETWVEVPALLDEVVWTMEGWLVNRNDTTRWKVNWKNLYGELESGTYRIGKNFSMSNYLDDYDSQSYYATFRIMDIFLGTATVECSVEELIDMICSSPLESSAPGAYIDAHRVEYNLLLENPEETLTYCFRKFLSGGQTDLRGHIMAEVCRELIKTMDGDILVGNFMTGQDWFDSYHHMVIQLWDMEEEEYPAANILRTLINQPEDGDS